MQHRIGRYPTISGLTVANGNTVGVDSGGGIRNDGTLTLQNSAVLNNSGGSGGGAVSSGAISSFVNSGTAANVTVTNCTTAINANNDGNAPPTDQRGYFRNAASDIGAFEFGGIAPVPPTPAIYLGNIATRLKVEAGTTR